MNVLYFVWDRSARLIAQYRPRAVIMAVTRSLKTARLLHIYRGCCPVYVEGKRVYLIARNLILSLSL